MKEFDGFQEFSAVYGPKGKIPKGMGDEAAAEAKQYDNLEIAVPKGLDEELVTAIVMGAALKKDRLDQNLTGAAEDTPEKTVAKNRKHLIDSVTAGDAKDKKFVPVLLDARKEAKEAIEAYANGDPKAVNELLGTFTDYCADNVKRITGPGEELDRTQKAFYLGQTVINKNAPGIKIPEGKSSQVEKATLNSYSKQIDAGFLAEQNKDILTNNFAAMDGNAKEMLVKDMLFYKYVSHMKDALKKSRRKATKKFVEDKISQFGIAPKSPEMEKVQELLADQKEEHIEEVEGFSISDFDAILAKPDGMNRLKQYYGDAIRQTQGYQKILQADSDQALKEALEGAEKEAKEGFLSFRDIKLPKESAAYHEDAQAFLNNSMNSFNRKIEDALFNEHGPLEKEIEAGGLKGFGKEDRLKFWLDVDEMNDELASHGGKKASADFKNLCRQMENLKDQADRIARKDGTPPLNQFVQYNMEAYGFCQEAGRFLEKTKGTESPEVTRQREAVMQIRKKLMCQRASYARLYNELKEKKTEEIVAKPMQMLNSMDPFLPSGASSVFWGEKYKDPESRKVKTPYSYSLGRAGAVGIAIFALINEGKYSFEEIMDPNCIQKEKQEMFDKVAKAMTRGDKEDQEWIARTIYDGEKNSLRMMNEAAKKTDFSGKDILKNKNLCMMLLLESARFECWQEMSHCEKEIVALANKEHPEIKNYNDYKDYYTSHDSLLCDVRKVVMSMADNVVSGSTGVSSPQDAFEQAMIDGIKIQSNLNLLSKSLKDHPEKEFWEHGSKEERLKHASISYIAPDIQDKVEDLNLTDEEVQQLLPRFMDGSIVKDMDFEYDLATSTGKVTGFPSREKLEELKVQPKEPEPVFDCNNISTAHASDMAALPDVISHIPGMSKYRTQLEELRQIGDRLREATGPYSELTKDGFECACGESMRTLREGESKEVRKDMERGLEIVRQLLSDKELMEKEPMLKGYLGVLETQTTRALSNRKDALGYLADDNAATMISAVNLISKIPTGQEYENLRKTNHAAEKLVRFMNAYSEYYALSEKLANYANEKGAEAGYLEAQILTDKKLTKLQEATQELANEKEENVRELFHILAGKNATPKEVDDSVDRIYKNEKHNLKTAAKQMKDRRKQIRKYLSVEEIGVLQTFEAQMKTILSNAAGVGAKIEHLPEPFKESMTRMKGLAEECQRKLAEGFENDAQKREFFKRLGEESRKFVAQYQNAEISEDASMEENRAMENLIGYTMNTAQVQNGCLRQAMDQEKKQMMAEKAADPKLLKGLKLYYDMMADTKTGYFGHTNSKEYNRMMTSVRNVIELGGKQPLNDMELATLSKSYEDLSKNCQTYLSDKKMKSKSTDIGEDRFAGALGILSVVDPVNAERLRNKASQIRGKNVTYSEIRTRANKRLAEREQKLAESAKKEKQTNKKTKTATKAAEPSLKR